jgi:hypothetical protein
MSDNSKQTLRDTGRLTLSPIALIAVVAGIVAICFHVTTIDVEPVVKWTVEVTPLCARTPDVGSGTACSFRENHDQGRPCGKRWMEAHGTSEPQ